MHQCHKRAQEALVIVILIAATSCTQQHTDASSAQLRIALPLELDGMASARVIAQQGTVRHEAEVKDGIARLQLLAGREAQLSATIVTIEPQAWRTYLGATAITPVPGPNDVDIAARLLPSRRTTIVPLVEVPETGQTVVWAREMPVAISEEQSGLRDETNFVTNAPMELPAGAELIAQIKDLKGEMVTLDLATSSSLPQRLEVVVGRLPSTTDNAAIVGDDGTVTTASEQIEGLTPLCALGTHCEEGLDWKPCKELIVPYPNSEMRFDLMLRYAEIEELVCQPLVAERDVTPPVLWMQTQPRLLEPEQEQTFEVLVSSSEPLASLTVEAVEADVATTVCDDMPTVLGGEAMPTYRCRITMTPSAGRLHLRARATDRFHNSGATEHDVVVANPSGQVVMTGVQTYPPRPIAMHSFLIGVSMENGTQKWLCGVEVAAFSQTTPIAKPIAPGADEMIWVPVWAVEAGSSESPIVTGYFSDSESCSLTSDTYASDASWPITIHELQPRWLNRAPLPLSTGAVGDSVPTLTHPLPLIGGPNPPSLDAIQVDPAGALEVTQSQWLGVRARHRAEAMLTATYGARSAETWSTVSEGSSLILLQQSAVTELRPGLAPTVEEVPLATVSAAIGSPIRLLWLSSDDRVVVVGKAGVQVGDSDQIIPAPCEAEEVIDAVATGRENRIALLIRDTAGAVNHAELDLGTSESCSAQKLSAITSCAQPSRIASNPASGLVTVAGAGCVAQYLSAPEGLSLVAQASVDALPAEPGSIALDPMRGYALVRAGSSAVGFGLGTAITTGEPLDLDDVKGALIDPLSGAPLMAVAPPDSVPPFELRAYANRFQTDVELSSFTLEAEPTGPMAFDSASRRVFLAARDAAFQKRSILYVVYEDGYLTTGGRIDLPLEQEILDIVVRGPQPAALSPSVVTPGAVVTVTGKGFAGNGEDEVFVLGSRAEVLSSSRTEILFEVPLELEQWLWYETRDITFSSTSVPLAVRSHGRVATLPAGASGSLVLTRHGPHSPLMEMSPGNVCTNSCNVGPLFDAKEPLASVDTLGLVSLGYVSRTLTPAPRAGAPLPRGDRIIGHDGSNWLDYRLASDYDRFFEPSARLVPFEGTLGPMAVAPSGRFVVAQANETMARFAGAGLVPIDSWTPSTLPSIARVAMLPDGQAAVAADSSGQLAIFPIGNAEPLYPALDESSCPNGEPQLLGLWPRNLGRPGITALLHYPDASEFAVLALHEDHREDASHSYQLRCSRRLAAEGEPIAATQSPSGRWIALAAQTGTAEMQLEIISTAHAATFWRKKWPGVPLALLWRQNASNADWASERLWVVLTDPSHSSVDYVPFEAFGGR